MGRRETIQKRRSVFRIQGSVMEQCHAALKELHPEYKIVVRVWDVQIDIIKRLSYSVTQLERKSVKVEAKYLYCIYAARTSELIYKDEYEYRKEDEVYPAGPVGPFHAQVTKFFVDDMRNTILESIRAKCFLLEKASTEEQQKIFVDISQLAAQEEFIP